MSGRYKVQRVLGAGAMGKVFLAEDTQMQRPVAIKQIVGAARTKGAYLARFAREAAIQARVQNPYVLKIYDALLDADPPMLVMEFVLGRDLAEVLGDEGPLPLGRAARYLGEVAEGLDALHAAGVLHRDIKPGNLMVRDDTDTALVMDLGLAGASDLTALTATGTLLGTPAYLAPEVILEDGWTPPGDQYALAVTFAELVAGVRPFRGMPMDQLLVAISQGVPAQYLHHPAFPPPLRPVLERATKLEPEARYPSCRAFAEAFARASLEAEVEASGEADLDDSLLVTHSGAYARARSDSLSSSDLAAASSEGGAAPSPPGARAQTPAAAPRRLASRLGLVVVVAVGLALGLGVGGPQGLRVRAVGDVLVVEFTGPAAPVPVRVELPQQVVLRTSTVDPEGHRVVVPGLTPGPQEVRVGVDGGAAEAFAVAALAPAVGPLRLGADGRAEVEVRRPVRLGWWGAAPVPTTPGTAAGPLPDGPAELRWVEDGVPSARRVDPDVLLDEVVEGVRAFRAEGAPGEEDPAALRLELELPARLAPQLLHPRRRGRATTCEIWEAFEVVEREAMLASLMDAAGTFPWDPLPLGGGLLRRYDLPLWRDGPGVDPGDPPRAPPPPGVWVTWRADPVDGRRPDPPRPKDRGGLGMTLPEYRAYPGLAGYSYGATFSWPDAPLPPGGAFVLWVEFLRGESRYEFRLRPRDDDDACPLNVFTFPASWAARVAGWRAAEPGREDALPSTGFSRWLGVTLPTSLAPAPGTPMLLEPRTLRGATPSRLWIRDIALGPPPPAGTPKLVAQAR